MNIQRFHAPTAREALAKHPEDRYPSAGDLGRAALAAAAGEPVTEQERTVATGAAAPAAVTTAMPTEMLARTSRGPEAPPEDPWEPPAHAPALTAVGRVELLSATVRRDLVELRDQSLAEEQACRHADGAIPR